ncbi:unnamed protein product [Microthlaspi erraticum]|uniref:Uncharacterized protein n=1 Tax=Microthlaspi erraticum TaxID=1685480 RepID=A0A6D2JXI7_9BRAS|nr:unnamed protein product [Microthlaspi erraticum]
MDLHSVGVKLQKLTLPNSSTILIFHSSILLSFDHLKLSVLFLAGEGTSGSWIPVMSICTSCPVLYNFGLRPCPSTSSSNLKKSLSRKLFSTCFKASPTEVAAHFDSKVSQLRDFIRRPNAGMFSVLLVWELFNISTSSVGMERSLPPSSLYRERTFLPLPFSMRSGFFSDHTRVSSTTLLPFCYLVFLSTWKLKMQPDLIHQNSEEEVVFNVTFDLNDRD